VVLKPQPGRLEAFMRDVAKAFISEVISSKSPNAEIVATGLNVEVPS